MLNRRKFFGAAAGAAAAAPAAKRVMLQAAERAAYPAVFETGPFNPGAVFEGSVVSDKDPGTWKLEQIAKAKRILSGDIRPEDMNWPTMGTHDDAMALRSVSDAGRHAIRAARHQRKCHQGLLENCKQMLADYDKTGLVRMIL